jgi:cell division FtsZ-interacting protein ZapD
MSAKILMQALLEASRELRSSIRNNGFGHTMETYHLLKINISIILRVIGRLDRNKVRGFG